MQLSAPRASTPSTSAAETIALSDDDAVIPRRCRPYIASLARTRARRCRRSFALSSMRISASRLRPVSHADSWRARRHGGMAVWLFGPAVGHHQRRRPADRYAAREELAKTIWNDAQIATLTGLPPELPPWQIVRERRATFAATPAQDSAKAPRCRDRMAESRAGRRDWTNTGLAGDGDHRECDPLRPSAPPR